MTIEKSVVMTWLSALTLKQQTVLLTAIRGCDAVTKNDASKTITRLLRSVILFNADSASTFMVIADVDSSLAAFMDGVDKYPMHWLLHLTHASEIIGYKHPDIAVRTEFIKIYSTIVAGFHMHIETEEELDERLK